MAGTVLGFMKFVLGFDTVEFKKGMTAAERDLAKLSKSMEKTAANITRLWVHDHWHDRPVGGVCRFFIQGGE